MMFSALGPLLKECYSKCLDAHRCLEQ